MKRRYMTNQAPSWLLIVALFALSIESVRAAPTTVSTAEANQPIESHSSSENIIRSIGFRHCSPYPLTQSSIEADDNVINLSSLAIMYDGQSNTVSIRADGSTEREFDATTAHIILTAYDRVVYDQTIELAKVAPLIPRFKGKFSFQETFPAPSLLPERLPKQLFSLPAVEALASIQLYNSQGNSILCTSVPLTNTVSINSPVITIASVSLTAAAIALSAISSILATLGSAVALTSVPLAVASGTGGGSANPSSGLSPSVLDVISFCQFIATTGSLNLEYPELLQQWTQNFAWSMGLVSSERWNRAINNLRSKASSGGTPDGSDGQFSSERFDNGDAGDKTASKLMAGSESNNTVTVLSMQSMVDSAVKSMVGNAGYNAGNIEAVAPEKMDPQMLMSILAVDRPESPTLRRRQVDTQDTTHATPSTTYSAIQVTLIDTTPVPTNQPGADVLPSLQDSSLMNRIGDIPPLKVMEQPSTTLLPPQPTHDAPWPLRSYQPSSSPLNHHGLASFGHRLNIPAENMFMTSLFLLLILLLATSLVALLLRIALEGYAYFRPGKFTKLRRRFGSYYIGSMLRVALLAYFAVATMAFYQFTLRDSWTITLIAVATLLTFVTLVSHIALKLRRAGGTSLYFDERLKSKYGALYDQYLISAYWFFVPVLAYQILKAAIVGLGHGGPGNSFDRHGSSDSWAQISLLLLVEICFAALLVWKHPFADRTPNHLNSALSFVRVLNIVMLAVLVEGTAVSTVSRTILGVIIAGTQALMMMVLACLIFYQLGKVLWQLRSTIKSRKQSNAHKESGGLDPLHRDEILAISATDKEKIKKDSNGKNKDDEPHGRMASEHLRSGEESMTSLVGMMGIGSNPKIQCTPASDDEDNDLDVDDGDYLGEMVSGRSQSRGTARIRDNLRRALRDPNGVNCQPSLIPNHCNPTFIPLNPQAKAPRSQLEIGTEQGNVGKFSEGYQNQGSLGIPEAVPDEPWIQSAYMTRRRHSESHASQGQRQGGTDVKAQDIRKTASYSQAPGHGNGCDTESKGDNKIDMDKYLQQRRRRPFSLGAARQGPVPSTFSTSMLDSRQRVSRENLGPGPTFRGIYIPDSLLAGPPPPSIQPQRTSITSATLITPPSLSPVLSRVSGGEFEAMISTPPEPLVFAEEGSEQGSVMSTPTDALQPIGIPYFEEYRFPDEQRPQVASGAHGSTRRSPQQAIHPLSPFHPDYQHPEDVYNAAVPSPNEEGPAYTRTSSLVSDVLQNVPNVPQDGRGSRRESQQIGYDTTAVISASMLSTASSKLNMILTAPVGHKKRVGPGLRIITALKASAPPPEIPIPTLPMTPITANLTLGAAAEGAVVVSTSTNNGPRQELTPMSISTPEAATKQNDVREPSASRFSNAMECTLASSSSSGSPPSRQRALSATPLVLPNRPLTVSGAYRDARAAR